MNESKNRQDIRVHRILLEVEIKAPSDQVWRGLTTDIAAWWPANYFVDQESLAMHLEPHPGGRMWEEWKDGGGLMWGQVITVKPGKLLQLASDLFPEYGGPARNQTTYRLTETETGTTLHFEEVSFGSVRETSLQGTKDAWTELFEQKLKPWCEQKM